MVLSGFKQNIGNPWHSITKVPPDILFWLQIDSEYSTLQAHSIYWEQMGAKISSWMFLFMTGKTNKIGFGMLPGVADFLSELNSLNSGQWNVLFINWNLNLKLNKRMRTLLCKAQFFFGFRWLGLSLWINDMYVDPACSAVLQQDERRREKYIPISASACLQNNHSLNEAKRFLCLLYCVFISQFNKKKQRE